MCHSKLASTRPSLGVSGTVSPPAELPDYAPTNVGVQSLWHYLPLTANAVAKSNAIFTFRATPDLDLIQHCFKCTLQSKVLGHICRLVQSSKHLL